MSHLTEKAANQINKQLALILQYKVKDPRVGIVSINEVKVTRDLSSAKVYVSAIGADENQTPAAVLNKMAGFLRSELAEKLSFRTVPQLRFYDDTVMQTGKEIEELLEQAKKS